MVGTRSFPQAGPFLWQPTVDHHPALVARLGALRYEMARAELVSATCNNDSPVESGTLKSPCHVLTPDRLVEVYLILSIPCFSDHPKLFPFSLRVNVSFLNFTLAKLSLGELQSGCSQT